MTATHVTCAELREALLALPLDAFAPGAVPFGAHVAGCAQCARDVARVRDADQRIGAALDTFADAGDFDAALAAAREGVAHDPTPIARPRRILPMLALAAVALAALAVPLAPHEPEPDAPITARRPGLTPPDAPDRAEAPEVPRPEVLRPEVPRAEVPALAPAPAEVPAPAARRPVPVPPSVPNTAVTGPPSAVGCGDPDALARRADLGKLTAGERVCLRRRVADQAPDAAVASRLVLADAWRTDRAAWTDLAAAHLTTVDPMDADVAYRLTLALAAAGEDRADDVIRWGGVAIGLAPAPERAVRLRAATTSAWLTRWRQLQAAGGEAAEQARASTAASAAAWAAESRRAGSDPSEADRVCALASGGVCPR